MYNCTHSGYFKEQIINITFTSITNRTLKCCKFPEKHKIHILCNMIIRMELSYPKDFLLVCLTDRTKQKKSVHFEDIHKAIYLNDTICV